MSIQEDFVDRNIIMFFGLKKSLAIWGLNSCLTHECIFKYILLLNQSLTLQLANVNVELIEVNQLLIIAFVKMLSAVPNGSPSLIGVKIQ